MAIELTALPDMTLEEAQLKHSELKSLESVMRSMLLEMRDRKGWLALGFESWADYGDKEWNYGRQYLDRLATSARIEKQIAPMGANEIPERHLRPMAKIPESEIAAIWEESNRKAEELGKDRTAKMVQDAVNEWKLKHDTVQNDLIAKTQTADELQRKVNYQAMTVDAVEKQNTELRELTTYV